MLPACSACGRNTGPTLKKWLNCLCTWFRFDQDAAGVRFGAQSLQERGQEGSVAISVPIEAKDELVETGLEALGAQPVADASSPALEVAERGVDPGENLRGGPVADDMGRWRSRGTALQSLQPSVLTIAVAAVLRTAKFRHLAFRCRAAAGWPRRSRPDRTAGCARG